jgi:dienelactone hydrolase
MFHLNPSEYHARALASLKPTLAYTGQPFTPWKRQLGGALRTILGWNDAQPRVPLNTQVLEVEETPQFTRKKLVFTSEPGADVPAHLLIPKTVHLPAPAFICLQGHSTGMHISIGKAKFPGDEKSIAGDRDFALQAVANGFIALALEQRCFGERQETLQKQRSRHTCEDSTMHALLLGRPMASERAWDVSRGVDLLETLPEVRRDRIGCMGNSGGGTVTYYAACVEPRIRLAMPSCSVCTYADSIFRIYHCTDNFLPGVLKVAEMADFSGLIAPRSLVIVAGQHDDIFPIEGVRRAYAQVERIYRAAGAQNRCRLIVGDEGHRFYAEQGWAAVRQMMAEADREQSSRN